MPLTRRQTQKPGKGYFIQPFGGINSDHRVADLENRPNLLFANNL